jgi:renalase
MTVLVVGAGIAGISCARELRAAGVDVEVLERSWVTGGRMASSRRQHPDSDRVVDIGASYFTARDDSFRAVADDWVHRGLVREWTDRFHVIRDGALTEPVVGPVRYAAPGGLRSLVEDLATGLHIQHRRLVRSVAPGPTVDGQRADAVVLAMPDPQALVLLAPELARERAALLDRDWLPALALTAEFDRHSWPAELDGAFILGDPVLSWVADDGDRRGDGVPVLVAHSTASFASPRLTHPSSSATELLTALGRLLEVPAPCWSAVHRWSYARPQLEREAPFFLGPARVGLACDGWGAPRIETAFLSGQALARALVTALA